MLLRSCCVLLALAAVSKPALAAPPFSLMPFRKIEADSGKLYPITQDHGPWMILCATFTGERAEFDARQLVYELRKRFKIEAYTHRRRYDFSKPVHGLGLNAFGKPKVMRHERNKSFDEIAVMAGNFQSVTDNDAQRLLKKIKKLRPEALDIEKRRTTQPFAVWRYVQNVVNPDASKAGLGPMGKAFMTRNPLIPASYFTQRGAVDDLVVKMNKGVKYSLLKNQARYTVRVAKFRGEVMLNAERNFKPNKRLSNKLEQAALKANRLTEALRAKGVEAYEFHDRHESIVTIGSFARVGNQNAGSPTTRRPH